MLRNKSIYRRVSILAFISLVIFASIATGSKQASISPEINNSANENVELQIPEAVFSEETGTETVNIQNRAENRMFAGGLDPKMLKELEKAKPVKNKTEKPAEKKKGEPVNAASSIAGKAPPVKAGVAATNTEKAEVSTIALTSGKHDEYLRVVLEGPHEIISAGEVRHKANVVSVTFSDANFSLEENKLAVPFRREQNKILFTQNNLEKIRTQNLLNPSRLAIDFYIKKVVAVEKAQPVSQNMEQIMLASTSIPAVEVQTPVSLMIPSVKGGDSNYDSERAVKQAEAEEFQTISKKEVQKAVDQGKAEPVAKAVLPVTPTSPESVNRPLKNAESEMAQFVTETEKNNVKEERILDPEAKFQPAVSIENSGSVLFADVTKEIVPVEMNDEIDKTAFQSVPEVTDSKLQITEGKRKIALLPFDNLSNNTDALDYIMPLIMVQLEDMGHDVLGYEEVEAYLCEKRIRQSSFLSREVAAELGKNNMVNTVMAGAVLTFSSEENPKIGILARLVDAATGHIIWSNFVSLTGEDFTRVLGLGTITSLDLLAPRALNSLFANFGNASQKPSGNEIYKIAVLPFKNESNEMNAGKIITHLFQNELANNPMFDPVDFGDIKQTIVNLRIGRKGEVDYNNLQELSKSLGVDVVLTGTVEEYQSGRSYSLPPSVTISARLLDSRRNRILWYDNLQLDGEENIIALDWGRLRSADKVAYGAVSGLVENMGTEGLLQ